MNVLLGIGCLLVNSAIDAESFNRFFIEKVAKVRSNTADVPLPTFSLLHSAALFTAFTRLMGGDVVKAVRQSADKFCATDPLPTSTLKQAVDLHAPFIVGVFNCSLV